MNRLRLYEMIIRDLEVLRTVLVITCIVAFCGWLVLGVGR